ncbi:MAG: hypothetical protein AAF514_03385 [Verrucomicrobiota bacterium]
MNLLDIKKVLNMAAFRPEPNDSKATWYERFPKERTLLVNVNRSSVSWQGVGKNGAFTESGEKEGSLEEVVPMMAEEWMAMTDNGWISISINNRFVLSLENNLSRKPGWAAQLRSNPKSILGSKYERGKRYGLHHHPETSGSILVTCEEGLIKSTEEAFKETDLKIGRVSCGLFAMLADVLNRIDESQNPAKRKKGEPEQPASPNFLLLVFCEGSVCILRQREHQWTEIRSRSGLYSGADISPVGQILTPMVSSLEAGTPVIFVNHTKDPGLHQLLPMSDQRWPGRVTSLRGS